MHHRFPAYKCLHKSIAPFQLIFSDLWGPSPHVSINDYRFYITFVDYYFRHTWLFPLKSKSQTFNTFVKFKTNIELQFNTKIN